MDDLGFVRSFVNGDKQARDEFLAHYSRLIYSAIRNILASRGFEQRSGHLEDIFQGILCSLLDDDCRRLRSFQARNGCSLGTWLRQVTINYTFGFLRKLKPTVSFDAESDTGTSPADILADDSLQPPDHLVNNERLDSLQECISRLDIEDKYFIELHINQGLGFQELKDLLGVLRGAFDMRKSRILEQLRDCFKSKGFALEI